ncbi:hypothetical protein G9A89_005523 [Geosiphon pyriformis]|nr:hypothetical protein G9A89_005523 [Geosiphon pyriformis]
MSEDIKRELEYAKTQYGRCVEKLEKFMEGEKGDRLEELKKNLREKEDVDENQRKKWTEEKEDLEKQEKKLEIEKDEWKEELLKWAEKLRTATDDTENHAPEISEDNHNESVDIWSVGYLILTAPAKLQESDKLKAYARKLSAINKLHRPTAEEALEWLWSEYYDILKEEFLEE